MITRTTKGTHNPRISAQTVANRLREIGEISPINNVCFICGVSFFSICEKPVTKVLILFSCPLGLWVLLWNFETISGSLMTPKWQKLASLAQEICTL